MSTLSPDANEKLDSGSPPRENPLILLPGLGGDARLFGPQRSAFPEMIVPHWIEPESHESLADYAARFAKIIDPGRHCFIGGVSFGGVVALEVASHLAARECYLIGSIRHPREIPKRLRVFRSMSDLVMIPKWIAPMALSIGERWMDPIVRGTVAQLKDVNSHFLRWAARAILNWTPSSGVARVRVVQIHGDRDPVFPIRFISPDKVVSGAGHLVSLRHSKVVNQFLRERMTVAANQ